MPNLFQHYWSSWFLLSPCVPLASGYSSWACPISNLFAALEALPCPHIKQCAPLGAQTGTADSSLLTYPSITSALLNMLLVELQVVFESKLSHLNYFIEKIHFDFPNLFFVKLTTYFIELPHCLPKFGVEAIFNAVVRPDLMECYLPGRCWAMTDHLLPTISCI